MNGRAVLRRPTRNKMRSNIFQAHAESLDQLRAEMDVDAPAPGTVTFIYQNRDVIYPALVNPFTLMNVQSDLGGGMTPQLMAEVRVNKSYLPPDLVLKSGVNVTVQQPFGPARDCRIHSLEDKYTFWQITVMDKNEGA